MSQQNPGTTQQRPAQPHQQQARGPQQPAAGATSAGAPSISLTLESFVSATRQLEAGLAEEKRRTRRLEDEISKARSQYEQLLRDAKAETGETVARESRLKAAIAAMQENEKKIVARAKGMADELKKTQAELKHYQAAWSGVLQREREAKLIIAESEVNARRIKEVEERSRKLEESLATEKARREQIERHAKSYQLELQNTLVRLHSAEGKFNELSKEYQTLSQAKRNMAEEVAKVEHSIRERFEWEAVKEREKLRAQMERDFAAERELIREELRQKIEAENGMKANFERERAQKQIADQDAEIARLKQALAESDARLERARAEGESARRELGQKLAQAEARIADSEQKYAAFSERMDEFRRDAASLRAELDSSESARDEIDRMKSQVERLSTELEAARRALESEKRRSSQGAAELEKRYRDEIVALQEQLLAKNAAIAQAAADTRAQARALAEAEARMAAQAAAAVKAEAEEWSIAPIASTDSRPAASEEPVSGVPQELVPFLRSKDDPAPAIPPRETRRAAGDLKKVTRPPEFRGPKSVPLLSDDGAIPGVGLDLDS